MATLKNRLYGVTSIKLGTCGTGGTMGSSLTAVAKLKRDSVEFMKDAPETFKMFIEESETPDFEALQSGNPFVLTFETYDVIHENMALAFGGNISTTNVWRAAVTESMTEKSVEICTKSVEGYYMKIQIPRASVVAALNAPLKRGDAGSIKFIVTALLPASTSGTLLPPVVMTLTSV